MTQNASETEEEKTARIAALPSLWSPEERAKMEDDIRRSTKTLELLGFTREEVQASEEELQRRGLISSKGDSQKTTRLICLCGHGMTRHTEFQGMWSCSPTKLHCPCADPRAVAWAQDTRLFKMKTLGAGVQHALMRGLLASESLQRSTFWTIDLKCDKCGSSGTSARLAPTPVDKSGKLKSDLNLTTWIDALLCELCRNDLPL